MIISAMKRDDLKEFLDEKVQEFNRPEFIETDPIQVARLFSEKENIEIAGFLTATISWGNRAAIIKNALRLMEMLDHQPHDFIMNVSPFELQNLQKFVHRTFNGHDLIHFIESLKNIYQNHGGLESVFETGFQKSATVYGALEHFFNVFFENGGERTRKHVSSVSKGASAKRLNMYLRWMCRDNKSGVDFGLWKGIPPSALMLPLDVHTGNVGRKLGLLQRKSNDWKAVEEITANLRTFDPEDPIKYDFALFGLGVFEKF
ncbi:TIGR02757 family protein [Maribellus sediminis]|uniref:TIGR02757 family protein n=1 Tax=Maribellus sediminis TaxID=2696285 RepID=UPI001F0CFD36|nr:TIGR02757 family protein [Maribellus sediminis]